MLLLIVQETRVAVVSVLLASLANRYHRIYFLHTCECSYKSRFLGSLILLFWGAAAFKAGQAALTLESLL